MRRISSIEERRLAALDRLKAATKAEPVPLTEIEVAQGGRTPSAQRQAAAKKRREDAKPRQGRLL